jgi:hypothetical protein
VRAARVLKPQVACILKHGVFFAFLASHLIYGVVDDLGEVKTVKGKFSIGQVISHTSDVGLRQVTAHSSDLFRFSLMSLRVPREECYGVLALTRSSRDSSRSMKRGYTGALAWMRFRQYRRSLLY